MKRGTTILFCIITTLIVLPFTLAELVCSGTTAYQITGIETCSSEASSNQCFKSSDGDNSNFWRNAPIWIINDPFPWVYGDLGETKCISGVRIQQELQTNDYKYGPQTINIQISNDAVNWQTVSSNWYVNAYNQWVANNFIETQARYVRFYFLDCNKYDWTWLSGWRFSEKACALKEFQILTRPALEICTPDCTGKECGSDGCDGTCLPGCINNHGTTSCNNGLCMPICDENWDNCDGDNTNGCETDLREPSHCGDCTNACSPGDLCIGGICSPPPDIHWANMKFQPITEAQIGDTVMMIYEDAGSEYNFEIYEDDLVGDDNIRTGGNAITGILLGNTLIAKWTITQQDFDIGFADELNSEVEFYFLVNGLISGNLIVERNSYNNQPPTVTLVSPDAGQRYKTQTSLDFKQIAEDEDDDLKITWDFGDGTSKTLTNCLTTNCNTTHSYSSSGAKTVTLTAEEMTRTQKDSESIPILLYNLGINLFPVITKPATGTVFLTNNIPFDASKSYAAKCSSICPPATTCIIVDDLRCYDYTKIKPVDIPNKYNLWFNWTFSEGLGILGNWDENYNQAVKFTKTFFQPITHRAYLKLGYDEPPFVDGEIQWSDKIFTEFVITTTVPQCVAEDELSYWKYWDIGTGQLITEEVTDESANCFKINGQPSTTCCPNDKVKCITDSEEDNFGKCVVSPNLLYCSDYNNIDDCDNFHPGTAKRSIDKMTGINNFCGSTQSEYNETTGETCWYIIKNCRCRWSTGSNTCESAYTKSDTTCEFGLVLGEGNCTFTTVSQTGNCETDDFVTYEWEADWQGPAPPPAECFSQLKQFSCENQIQLPFFTSLNFIISVLAITLIYVVLNRRKSLLS